MSPGPGAPTLIAGAQELGIPLSDTQLAQLEAYLDLLQRWGRTYNLTAILDRDAMRVNHLLDSLALLPHLPAREGPSASAEASGNPHSPGGAGPESARAQTAPVLLDVGSGAGLPGVVVAIARPDWQVICVDSVAKKAGFIRQVAAELRLPNLQALHARVEAVSGSQGWQALAPHGATVITSRAFASLGDFFSATQALISRSGEWLALKGQPPVAEIEAWRERAQGLGLGPESLEVIALQVPGLAAQRCLVRRRMGVAA